MTFGRAVFAVTLGSLIAASGCKKAPTAPPELLKPAVAAGVVQLNDQFDAPMPNQRLRLFIDTGVRCVQAPCDTGTLSWFGTTDAAGRFTLPPSVEKSTRSVYVHAYGPVQVPRAGGVFKLEPSEAWVKEENDTLHLGVKQLGQAVLTFTVKNYGSTPMTLVWPAGKQLERNAAWGGWTLTVINDSRRYEPVPVPGAFVPPTEADVVRIEPGGSKSLELDASAFEVMPVGSGKPLSAALKKLELDLAWGGAPELGAKVDAPAMSGSAVIETP